jgi:hypothetical protein
MVVNTMPREMPSRVDLRISSQSAASWWVSTTRSPFLLGWGQRAGTWRQRGRHTGGVRGADALVPAPPTQNDRIGTTSPGSLPGSDVHHVGVRERWIGNLDRTEEGRRRRQISCDPTLNDVTVTGC